MELTQAHYFCVRKALLFYYFVNHIAQLLLTLVSKFYCFRPCPQTFIKYVRHNHLRSPMLGVVDVVLNFSIFQ